jgi:putative lysine transport system permease protein
MIKKFIPLFKKLIVFALIVGFIYALAPHLLTSSEADNHQTTFISDASGEAMEQLTLAANSVNPYHFGNKQSLTPNRLKQVTSDIALPAAFGEVVITWSSSSTAIMIEATTSTISVASPNGLIQIEVYKGIVSERPNVFEGSKPFTLTAVFALGDATLIKTYEGAVVAQMPSDFWGGFVYTFIRYISLFAEGVATTLGLSLTGTIIGFIIALILVALRLLKPNSRDQKSVAFLKKFGSGFAKVYITVFRGTPMIVQASFFWYGLGLFGDALLCGLFVVSVNTAAYIAEILRGSIGAIDKGQTEASRSLGMNSIQTMISVIFPQSVKNSMPAIGNEFVINIKDTAVLSVIGIFELFNQTTKVAGIHYRQLEAYLVVALIYLFLTYTVTKILQRIEKRFDIEIRELPSSN